MAHKFYREVMGLKQNYPKELLEAIFPKPSTLDRARATQEIAKKKWEAYKANVTCHISKDSRQTKEEISFGWEDLRASRIAVNYSKRNCPMHNNRFLTGLHLRDAHTFVMDDLSTPILKLAKQALTENPDQYRARLILQYYWMVKKALTLAATRTRAEQPQILADNSATASIS